MRLGRTVFSCALWPVLYIGTLNKDRGLYLQWLHWRLDLGHWRTR